MELKTRNKVAFCIGAFGKDVVYMLITSYLLYYYNLNLLLNYILLVWYLLLILLLVVLVLLKLFLAGFRVLLMNNKLECRYYTYTPLLKNFVSLNYIL